MKGLRGIASVVVVVLVTLIFSSHAAPRSDIFFVTAKNTLNLNQILSKLGHVKITPLLGGAIIKIEVLEGNADDMMQSLKNHPSITNVLPNVEIPFKNQEVLHDDVEDIFDFDFPQRDYTWWKNNYGGYHLKIYEKNKRTNEKKLTDDFPSIMGADINLENAHRIEMGSPEVIVGVIDSGIDLTHPALAHNIYRNPGEIPGNNTDDDGNGYVDDVNGWNFAKQSGDVSDTRGHGTMVSGVIAGNGDGFEGVCPQCRILPIVLRDMRTSDLFDAADYIQSRNVKIVNMSAALDIQRVPEESRDIATSISHLFVSLLARSGIVFVAAAGNSGREGNPTMYPAFFEEAIAVGGSDPWDMYAYFSNYGPWVDIVAPAIDIWTTQLLGKVGPRAGYNYASGTSLATPMVAGAAALLLSHYPRITAEEIKQTLLHPDNTTLIDDRSGLRPSVQRLDVFKALKNPIFEASELLLEVPNMPDEEKDEMNPLGFVWH